MQARSLLLVVAFLSVLLSGCPEQRPLKIGFLGGLSGRHSSLGIAGRNGVTLAVEQINSRGGLNGRPLELVTRDDRQESLAAVKGFRELQANGVVAVIGPLTSAMAVSVVPESDRLRLVTIGPTISTNDLSGKDDYFFRMRPASRQVAETLAQHLSQATGIRRLSIVYDLNNRAHTESWHHHLKQSFEALGGQVVASSSFTSSDETSFLAFARELTKTPTDAVMILANGLDTALICQQLNKLGFNRPLFASEWSFTEDLLPYGGKTVEGLTVIHTYDPDSDKPASVAFREAYAERFGVPPNFAAAHSYDAARLLFAALERDPDPSRLKQTLASMAVYEGIQSTLRFDRFGDVERKLFLTRVENGRFVLREEE